MIDYLIRSGLCLIILLAVYHLFLEREKMHRFNRFYLLFSLVFGLLVPLITIEVSSVTVPYMPAVSNADFIDQAPMQIQDTVQASIPSATLSWGMQSWIIFIYGLGTGILLTRFAGNLFKILSRISRHSRLPLENATVILLPGEVLPHSFLNYVFINEDDYKANRVEDQLFIHELAHVRQKHSLDILFIEILRIVFWFNPLFILYKKAIQLNHEFLADEAVVKSYDISDYQYLLLEKSISKHTVQLASNLNYSVTRKRLMMMIKTTSGLRIWTTGLAIVPVIVLMLFFFSTKAISEAPSIEFKSFTSLQKPSERETYFKGAIIHINKNGISEIKKYDEMTAAEKAALPDPPPVTPKKIPTKEMFDKWVNSPSLFGVRIEGKRIKNSELARYKPGDFGMYYVSGRLNEFARTKLGYSFQVSLTTNASYEEKYIKSRSVRGKSLWYYEDKQGKLINSFPPPVVIRFPPPVVVPKPPTQSQIDEWKDSASLSIVIDGKSGAKNSVLADYNLTDFASYYIGTQNRVFLRTHAYIDSLDKKRK